MINEERVFIKPVLTLKDGDRTVVSPVWFVPAEIFSRGMLKKPSYQYRTVVIDAMTGAFLLDMDRDPTWEETRETPPRKILQPVIERFRAAFLAERSLQNRGHRGWRSFGNYLSVQVDPEKALLRWRHVVLRDRVALDGLTAEPLKGSELLTALLDESTKVRKKGGPR